MTDSSCPGCRRPMTSLRLARWVLWGPLLLSLGAGLVAPFGVWFVTLSPLSFVLPSTMVGAQQDVFLVLIMIVPWLLTAVFSLGDLALRDLLGRPVPAPVAVRAGYRHAPVGDPRCDAHRGHD